LAPAYELGQASGRGTTVEAVAVIGSDYLTEKAVLAREFIRAHIPEELYVWLRAVVSDPVLYVFIPFIMLLEYLFPADVGFNRKWRIAGYLQDLIWFVMSVPIIILVYGFVGLQLKEFYQDHLAFLTVDSASGWSFPVQFAVALLLSELLVYSTHLIRHKVHVFWIFHAVHHSQKELNVFTDDRQHIVDRLIFLVLSFIPLLMFQVEVVVTLAMYMRMHSRLIHANLRMDFGLLGYILASPQFHRVHHSKEPEHRDKNFGGILSLFDYVFGTASKFRGVYPATGIEDRNFPTADKYPLWQLPLNWIRQTLYPFAQISTSLWRVVAVRSR
jgi:sterol desaturase/sphingolipid hydroxylase (fatty acid hydroxylase superfamily)